GLGQTFQFPRQPGVALFGRDVIQSADGMSGIEIEPMGLPAARGHLGFETFAHIAYVRLMLIGEIESVMDMTQFEQVPGSQPAGCNIVDFHGWVRQVQFGGDHTDNRATRTPGQPLLHPLAGANGGAAHCCEDAVGLRLGQNAVKPHGRVQFPTRRAGVIHRAPQQLIEMEVRDIQDAARLPAPAITRWARNRPRALFSRWFTRILHNAVGEQPTGEGSDLFARKVRASSRRLPRIFKSILPRVRLAENSFAAGVLALLTTSPRIDNAGFRESAARRWAIRLR